MIYLLRCNSILTDSRVLKYISFYKGNEIDYRIVGWDRTNEGVKIENGIIYQKKSGYRVGGLKAAYYRILWMRYVLKQLKKASKVDTIHACDLDTAFPAVIYKVMFNRNVKIIFDVFDWFSDNLGDQNALIKGAFKLMEKISVKWADIIIICEPERREQIPYQLKTEPLIFPNIPSFSNYDFLKDDKSLKFDNGLLTLAYVGGFINDRFLKELLQLADEHLINLLIAGYGEENIVELCNSLKERDNVQYLGKVPYQKGLTIMYNSDIIYAMYCKVSRNNIFAAPNKYYEAMLLGKPIISTKGTILEKKIVDNNMGYVVEENYQELKSLVSQIKRDDMLAKGKNARDLWDGKYQDYTQKFLREEYMELIKS